MSTITTTPVPTIGRKPVVIGVAVLGVVTIAAVTIPNIHLSGTTAVPTVVQAQAPDALDRRDAMRAASAAESSRRIENLLDSQARAIGHRAVVVSPAAALPAHLTELGALATAYGAAATSVGREQVGGLHATYVYNVRAMTSVIPTQAYDGRSLHLTWSDPWVPPVDNPDWTPFIRAHYYGGTVPERVVTRGD